MTGFPPDHHNPFFERQAGPQENRVSKTSKTSKTGDAMAVVMSSEAGAGLHLEISPVVNGGSDKRSELGVPTFPTKMNSYEQWGAGWSDLQLPNHILVTSYVCLCSFGGG